MAVIIKKMSEKFSAELKLIGTGVMLVIALLAFLNINGTLGWFASSDEVSANDMSVKISSSPGVVKSVDYFEIADVSFVNGHNVYSFSADPAEGELTLPTYSVLNAKRQVLVKITLNEGVDSVSLEAITDATEFINDENVSVTGNSLSSVVLLRMVTSDQIVMNDEVISISEDQTQEYHFTTVEQNGNVLTPTFSPDPIDLGTVTTPAIFIIIDYYDAAAQLATEIINHNMSSLDHDELIANNMEVGFVCDFKINVK